MVSILWVDYLLFKYYIFISIFPVYNTSLADKFYNKENWRERERENSSFLKLFFPRKKKINVRELL